ncbi:hypothetical protein [Oribacterium sp.]
MEKRGNFFAVFFGYFPGKSQISQKRERKSFLWQNVKKITVQTGKNR